MKRRGEIRPPAPAYEIGYGKPPANGQFRKGRSGNPKGRPRKASPSTLARTNNEIGSLVLTEAARRVAIREGEKVREISVIEAVIKAETAAAVKGSPIAQRNFMERVERHQAERVAEVAKERAFWQEYVEKYPAIVANLRSKGEPIPKDWPHPDDISFNSDGGVLIDWPTTEEERRSIDRLSLHRDALLLQAEWDNRHYPKVRRGGRFDAVSTACVAAQIVDRAIPRRLRLGADGICARIEDLSYLNKWQLKQRLAAAWAQLGLPPWRGQVWPALGPILDKSRLGVSDWADHLFQKSREAIRAGA